MSQNRIIGNDGKLIKHIPGDLPRFKKLTMGSIVVMGRKTFESIGKPLPGRTNIVLSKREDYNPEGVLVYRSIQDVISLFTTQNIFVIGGGEIYNLFLPYADRIEMTLVEEDWEGDTLFPTLSNTWFESNRETKSTEDFTYHYLSLEKNN